MTLWCFNFFVTCLLIFSQSFLRVFYDDKRHRIQYWDASEPQKDIYTDIRTSSTLQNHGRNPDRHPDVWTYEWYWIMWFITSAFGQSRVRLYSELLTIKILDYQPRFIDPNPVYSHTIVLMDYIRTNYWNLLPKQLQENEIALDSQWDPTNPIAVLFICIEYWKLFTKSGEDPFTKKKIILTLHTLTSKTLYCSTWYVIHGKTSTEAPKFVVTSSSSL